MSVLAVYLEYSHVSALSSVTQIKITKEIISGIYTELHVPVTVVK